jgi:hypothetical protein
VVKCTGGDAGKVEQVGFVGVGTWIDDSGDAVMPYLYSPHSKQ